MWFTSSEKDSAIILVCLLCTFFCLTFSIDKPDVVEFFKQCGPIADIRFSSDEDGRFKGFGHIEFETEEGAQKAVKLNGKELCGRPVKLDFAVKKTPASKDSSSESEDSSDESEDEKPAKTPKKEASKDSDTK
ncbi:hypothetical protein MKW92_040830 [Papaver armeniacum]|nr:hypothetical protein MKW92_040830 [Papaver armeniacum]